MLTPISTSLGSKDEKGCGDETTLSTSSSRGLHRCRTEGHAVGMDRLAEACQNQRSYPSAYPSSFVASRVLCPESVEGLYPLPGHERFASQAPTPSTRILRRPETVTADIVELAAKACSFSCSRLFSFFFTPRRRLKTVQHAIRLYDAA